VVLVAVEVCCFADEAAVAEDFLADISKNNLERKKKKRETQIDLKWKFRRKKKHNNLWQDTRNIHSIVESVLFIHWSSIVLLLVFNENHVFSNEKIHDQKYVLSIEFSSRNYEFNIIIFDKQQLDQLDPQMSLTNIRDDKYVIVY